MRFEWDNTKRLANIRKHGIDFVACEAFFEGQTVTLEDKRFNYGERRFVSFGTLEDRIVAVVHTETEELIRVISIRKATRREQAFYFKNIKD